MYIQKVTQKLVGYFWEPSGNLAISGDFWVLYIPKVT